MSQAALTEPLSPLVAPVLAAFVMEALSPSLAAVAEQSVERSDQQERVG